MNHIRPGRPDIVCASRTSEASGRPLIYLCPIDIPREFEAMQEKIELLTDIHTAVNQLAAGEGIDQDEAKANVLKRIRNGKQILPVDEILNKT